MWKRFSGLRAVRLALLALGVAASWGCADAERPASPGGTVRVAAIQYVSEWAQPARNREGMEALIRDAARQGAKIVVLPELAIPGYLTADILTAWRVNNRPLTPGLTGASLRRVAEAVPGESTRFFGALAKELGIYLTVPILEVDGGRHYNTLVLVGHDGEILLHYRKLNPWWWAERGWATKGDRGLQFIDTPYGRLGLLICHDINFETPAIARNEVDHLLYSIAWVDNEKSTWFARGLPALARRTGVNIIGANWSVPDPGPGGERPSWFGYGKSLVIERSGKVLSRAQSDFGNAVVIADLPIPSRDG